MPVLLILASVLTESAVPRAVLTQAFTWGNSASAAGTAGAAAVAGRVGERFDRLSVRDMDESGVPQNPPRYWRNHITEEWIQRALAYQADGVDLLLTGQTPLGEILASPSAPLLDGIAMCLVDVADAERRRRLAARDSGRWSEAAIDAYIN